MSLDAKQFLNGQHRHVVLKEIDLEICSAYAEAVYETNKAAYANRNQKQRHRLLRQNVCGKMAELAFYDFVTRAGLSASFPDFMIYRQPKKSFSPDMHLEYNGRKISCHVKSQDKIREQRWSASWLFEKNKDPLVMAPLEHADELLVFVRVDDLKVEIRGMIWVPEALPYFKATVLPFLSTKTALYYNDLAKAGLV